LPALDSVVLLRTDGLTAVRVDPPMRRATADGGALWASVVEPAAAAGLVGLHGSSPGVGVVGYSVGGGIGWYARQYGLQCNSVTAVELVLADGSMVRADADHEPDLFWAVRGGGGSFGVVTRVEFELYPAPSAIAGVLMWDWQHAERVLERWLDWTHSAPETATTSLRIMQIPPLPQIPEPIRGRQLVVFDGALLVDDDEAERLLAPLRELGPELDTYGRVPPPAVAEMHMDPKDPSPGVSGSTIADRFPAEAAAAFLAAVGPDSDSKLVSAELRQLGGALSRAPEGAGALPTLDGEISVTSVGIAMSPETAAKSTADATRLRQAIGPFSAGLGYLNFADGPMDVSTAFSPETWQRLRTIKGRVDPDGRIIANHPVPPA
jgi:FAD/FMN-containing dehydrogenase